MSLNHTRKNNEQKKSLPESNAFKLIKRKWDVKETPVYIWKKGSMTVEASMILFFLASLFVLLLYFFRMMQVQLFVGETLEYIGRELAVYAAVREDAQSKEQQISNEEYLVMAKALFLAQGREKQRIEQTVTGGVLGIVLSESEFEGDYIRLKARYQVKIPIQVFGRKGFSISQQTTYRKWTGWKETQLQQEEECWVYVAKNGMVYHKTSSCPYLKLSIQSVDASTVDLLRSESGQKYRECTQCAKMGNRYDRVYITNYGDCYHFHLNCSGIKRTIEMIRMSETGGKGACSKCWE